MLPPDVLRHVFAKLHQDDLAKCMLLGKYMHSVATDPCLWNEMTVRDPDDTAVRFFTRVKPARLRMQDADPDDCVWFLDRLVDTGAHLWLQHLEISLGVVARVSSDLLAAAARFPELVTLKIDVEECEELSTMHLPGWFSGLRKLRDLVIREHPPAASSAAELWARERGLVVRLGQGRALLASLQSITLVVCGSDLLTGTTGLSTMASLQRVVHITDKESYDNFTVGPGQTLDHLEVSFGEESLADSFGDGLIKFGSIGQLVVHARNELFLGARVPAREMTLVMDSRAFGCDSQIVLDYDGLAASDQLRALGIDQTDSSKPGWSVRFINVPSMAVWVELVAKIRMTVAPPGQIEITPYDF